MKTKEALIKGGFRLTALALVMNRCRRSWMSSLPLLSTLLFAMASCGAPGGAVRYLEGESESGKADESRKEGMSARPLWAPENTFVLIVGLTKWEYHGGFT